MTRRRKISVGAAAVLIGFCACACLRTPWSFNTNNAKNARSPELRRSLRLTWRGSDRMKPLTAMPNPEKETVLFWHIPKSGGTTLKELYKCMRQTLAVRVGVDPKFGHHEDKEIVAFEPTGMGATFVNVDTLTPQGILRAAELGLVPSGKADLIVTTGSLNFAVEHLFDKTHKGRVLGLFRHPVERLISKFYYIQIATWERSYRPDWKEMSVEYWAEHVNNENNHMVKTLAGRDPLDDVTEEDLEVALKTIHYRFVVGLTAQMEESVHRFNVFMGINEADPTNRECMNQYFGHGVKRQNSNPHPHVEIGSKAWVSLAAKNELDIRLFESVTKLFEEQQEVIASYAKDVWSAPDPELVALPQSQAQQTEAEVEQAVAEQAQVEQAHTAVEGVPADALY
mmetsp:Transcript_29403/g.50060  ORF Transcript_29403/g.50060 Transcript_29403/m.50060 type:complete len:397 (+) Transcript_29403:118-1308(+)